jgi:hypothetical protein
MNPPLHKASPSRLRLLTLRNIRSGAEKRVEYLGLGGIPLRAQIHWPIAGDYLVSLRTGTIISDKRHDDSLRAWRLSDVDRAFLTREARRFRGEPKP